MATENIAQDADFVMVNDEKENKDTYDKPRVEVKTSSSMSIMLSAQKDKLKRIEETIKRKKIEKKEVLKAIKMLEATRDQLNKLT